MTPNCHSRSGCVYFLTASLHCSFFSSSLAQNRRSESFLSQQPATRRRYSWLVTGERAVTPSDSLQGWVSCEPPCLSSAISQSQKVMQGDGGERPACTFPNQVSRAGLANPTTPRRKIKGDGHGLLESGGSRSWTELKGGWALLGRGTSPTALIRRELLAAGRRFSPETCEKINSLFCDGKA